MSLNTRTRPSLLVRMIVSIGFVSAIAITVAVVAAAVTGLIVFLALTAVFYLVQGYVLSLTDVGWIELVWGLWISNASLMVLVIGVGLLPVIYIQPVRAEIREFERDLGGAGDLATTRHPKIATMVRRLSQQADISEPDVRIVNRRRPETYALGGQSDGTIVITRGTIRTLTDDEIEAVLAHEVSHLLNGDGRIMNLLLVPMLIAERMSTADRPTFQFGHGLGVFRYTLSLFVWVLLTLVTRVQLSLCHLGVTFLSREREFAADRGSAELTGSPSALANALETLHDARGKPTQDMRDFKRSAGTLDILPPEGDHHSSRLFRTHPDTEKRIQALKAMVTETGA